MAKPTVSLIYVDHYHLGDALFLQALSHAVARALRADLRPVLVHGPGEYVERRLEGEGLFLEREEGVPVATTLEEQEIITYGLRDLNRRLGRMLTDAIVPAVSVFGADRALIRIVGDEVVLGRTSWLEGLVAQATVPVIAAAAIRDRNELAAIDPARVLTLLASLFTDPEIVVFTRNNLPGILKGSEPKESVTMTEVEQTDAIAEMRVAEVLVLHGHPVLLTNTVRYPGGDKIRGSWLRG